MLELAIRRPNDSAGVEAMRLLLAEGDLELVKAALAGTNAASVGEALGNTRQQEIVPLLLPLVTESARDVVGAQVVGQALRLSAERLPPRTNIAGGTPGAAGGTPAPLLEPMHDVSLRKVAVHALAQLQEGAAALLDLVKAGKLPDDLKFIASAELNGVRWPQIKAGAAELLPLPQGKDAEPLPPISELAKLSGDAVKGAEVFRRETVGCIKCHQVNGEGTDFGPSLSEIGAKLGKDALYESILDPSAGISFGYEAWQIELKNGDEAYGLLVNETADELAIKAIGGIITRYKRVDVVKRQKQKLSIMPAGLERAMSKQELVDLVEYLVRLKPGK